LNVLQLCPSTTSPTIPTYRIVADEEFLPFADNTFDLAISSLRYVLPYHSGILTNLSLSPSLPPISPVQSPLGEWSSWSVVWDLSCPEARLPPHWCHICWRHSLWIAVFTSAGWIGEIWSQFYITIFMLKFLYFRDDLLFFLQGFSPHISPFAELRDMGSLLNRAGYNLTTIVSYWITLVVVLR
jgi:hypothetical protein